METNRTMFFTCNYPSCHCFAGSDLLDFNLVHYATCFTSGWPVLVEFCDPAWERKNVSSPCQHQIKTSLMECRTMVQNNTLYPLNTCTLVLCNILVFSNIYFPSDDIDIIMILEYRYIRWNCYIS